MNASGELRGLYERWRTLTGSEAAAIRSGRWDAVAEIQSQKFELQAEIEAASARSPSAHAQDPSLGRMIRELMERESDNARELDLRLEAVREERADLDRSGHNLRRLRGSYGQSPAGNWHSYS